MAGEDHSAVTSAPAADAARRSGAAGRSDGPVVAIDGPSGAGKSTIARELARRHGWRLVDTGAMYRAVTWAALEGAVPGDDAEALTRLAESLPLHLGTSPEDQRVSVGNVDVTAAIRSPEVTSAVSAVSAIPGVRRVMVERQRRLASGGGVVVEGRDIGTTVLPAADVKVFLTASEARRAARRSDEIGASSTDVASAMALRDRLDSSRTVSPLVQPPDAVVIDSSELSIPEVVDQVERALAEGVPRPPTPTAGDRSQQVSVPEIGSARAAVEPGWDDSGSGRTRRRGPGLRVARWLAQRLVHLLLQVRVVGEDRIPAGPVLLAGNHTGFLDGPLVYILLHRPSCFLAKAELFDGFWAPVLRWAQQIPVRRGEPDRAALQAALDALADGELVGMFPEGTRGEGKLETIQDGVGYIAAMSGCLVVPVVCRGTARALPRGRLFPRLRTRVEIFVGEPFQVSAEPPLRRHALHHAAEEIAEHLRGLVDEVGLE